MLWFTLAYQQEKYTNDQTWLKHFDYWFPATCSGSMPSSCCDSCFLSHSAFLEHDICRQWPPQMVTSRSKLKITWFSGSTRIPRCCASNEQSSQWLGKGVYDCFVLKNKLASLRSWVGHEYPESLVAIHCLCIFLLATIFHLPLLNMTHWMHQFQYYSRMSYWGQSNLVFYLFQDEQNWMQHDATRMLILL